jgi:hypothetical protein
MIVQPEREENPYTPFFAPPLASTLERVDVRLDERTDEAGSLCTTPIRSGGTWTRYSLKSLNLLTASDHHQTNGTALKPIWEKSLDHKRASRKHAPTSFAETSQSLVQFRALPIPSMTRPFDATF